MSRKHTTGQSGKGRPTPSRPSTAPKGRPTPSRSSRGPKGASGKGKGTVYRQRRYAPLPLLWKLLLATIWIVALVLAIVFLDSNTQRVGVMIAVTFALPLLVVLVRDPSRRAGR